MRRIAFVTALVAALAAVPVLAEESPPTAGTEKDPFSQGYTGIQEHAAPSPAERDRKDASAHECHCAHGHDAPAPKPHDPTA